ncbi:MAG: phosphodiester glycosidase family protein [Oscillospiraceae bacterium]
MQEEFHNITIKGGGAPSREPKPNFDPKTGQPLHSAAPGEAAPSAPEAAQAPRPRSEAPVQPPHAEAAPGPQARPAANFDPKTGARLRDTAPPPAQRAPASNFDPKTGRPLRSASEAPAAPPPTPAPAAPLTKNPDIGATAAYQLGYEAELDTASQPIINENAFRRQASARKSRPRRAEERTPASRRAPEEDPPRRKGRVRRAIFKTLGVVAVFLISVVALLYGAITLICTGPFPNAKQLFVVSVTETSAVKFLAYIHFTEEEVQEILAANTVLPISEVTDTTIPFQPPPEEATEQDIEIHEVSGSTFVGKMMIIQDPSRVELRCLDAFGPNVRGKKIEEFSEENNATAAINAGFFDDPGGVGKGGQPLGLLIQGGKIRNGSTGMTSTIIGFDTDNHLIVGKMSGQEALDRNIRDAVTVEPTIMPPLIVNGNPVEYTGNGSGLNPRTALGQRSDGAVLMLVIDGRQPHSLGATIQDCLELMLQFDAINASMQDGGSSSVMVYEGETINVCSSLYGSRSQPSAWLVF